MVGVKGLNITLKRWAKPGGGTKIKTGKHERGSMRLNRRTPACLQAGHIFRDICITERSPSTLYYVITYVSTLTHELSTIFRKRERGMLLWLRKADGTASALSRSLFQCVPQN